MKIYAVFLMFYLIIATNLSVLSQRRWETGFSISLDKITIQQRVAASNETYFLNNGLSINFIAQYNFNKYLFLRSGIGHYFFAHQYKRIDGYSPSITIRDNTDGFIDLPLILGVNSPEIVRNFNLYGTFGVSGSENFFSSYTEKVSSYYYTYGTRTYLNFFQFFGGSSFLLTIQSSMGIAVKTNDKLTFFAGLNYRQQLLNPYYLFGNFGLNLGMTCQVGK